MFGCVLTTPLQFKSTKLFSKLEIELKMQSDQCKTFFSKIGCAKQNEKIQLFCNSLPSNQNNIYFLQEMSKMKNNQIFVLVEPSSRTKFRLQLKVARSLGTI